MGAHARHFKTAVSSSLILSLLVLAGCNKPGDTLAQNYAANVTPPQPAPYTPPTADQLSQMVAPIALFPDKLVGQVLAGATYPDQISAANQWLAQNPSLKGEPLQAAEASQPWDVSVKSLTTFPSVLGQMANNIQWTTALGEAYVNDPNDVMNAIQVLRSRAQQSGNLKTSPHLKVSTVVRDSAPPAYVTQSPSEPVVYSGPAVIPPPPQTIVIEPAQPDVVYVPQYNPTVVYGAPMPVYPGWTYHQPAYTTETLVTTGALSFGIGVLVGAAVSHHHDWGWNSWGVNWGGPAPDRGYDGGWHRPAVVYNNSTYISKSVTVVNHVNNINVTNNNYRTTNNVNNVVNRTQNFGVNNPVAPRPAGMMNAPHFAPNAAPVSPAHVAAANPAPQRQGGMMSMPHFTQHDAIPGSRPIPAAAAQPMHAAAAPHVNQFAAVPHNAPTPPMVQHDLHQPPPVPHALQAAKMAPPEAMKPAHEESRVDRTPAQAQMERPHADAMREHMEQERSAAIAHLPAAPRAEPGMQRAPLPNREANRPGHVQPQAIHQDVLAMHNAHPRPVEQHPVKRVEKHEQNAHNHDKHEAPERHG